MPNIGKQKREDKHQSGETASSIPAYTKPTLISINKCSSLMTNCIQWSLMMMFLYRYVCCIVLFLIMTPCFYLLKPDVRSLLFVLVCCNLLSFLLLGKLRNSRSSISLVYQPLVFFPSKASFQSLYCPKGWKACTMKSANPISLAIVFEVLHKPRPAFVFVKAQIMVRLSGLFQHSLYLPLCRCTSGRDIHVLHWIDLVLCHSIVCTLKP